MNNAMHNTVILLHERRHISNDEYDEMSLYNYELQVIKVEEMEHLYESIIKDFVSSLYLVCKPEHTHRPISALEECPGGG